MPGGSEWLIIAIAILILFGAKKIPEFMKGVGKGMREFTNAKDEIHRSITDAVPKPEAEPLK